MTLMKKNYVIKEKLNDIICQSSSDYQILDNAYNYIEELEQQCRKQKEVIDKAKEKLIELAKNFKQEEHIGTAYDDDIFYEELFEIFEEVSK